MQVSQEPFFIVFMPESPEELKVARQTFQAYNDGPYVYVKAVTDAERDAAQKKFQDAMKRR